MKHALSVLFAIIIIVLALLVLLPPPDRRVCDKQCNTAQCACIETCPKDRQ